MTPWSTTSINSDKLVFSSQRYRSSSKWVRKLCNISNHRRWSCCTTYYYELKHMVIRVSGQMLSSWKYEQVNEQTMQNKLLEMLEWFERKSKYSRRSTNCTAPDGKDFKESLALLKVTTTANQHRLQHQKVSTNAKSWVDAWDKWTMDLETILTTI